MANISRASRVASGSQVHVDPGPRLPHHCAGFCLFMRILITGVLRAESELTDERVHLHVSADTI